MGRASSRKWVKRAAKAWIDHKGEVARLRGVLHRGLLEKVVSAWISECRRVSR